MAQGGLQIADEPQVIDGLEISWVLLDAFLLTELDGGHALKHQPYVEGPEKCNRRAKQEAQREPEEKEKHLQERCVLVDRPNHGLWHRPQHHLRGQHRVEEEKEEKLVIVKADTIIYPRTMVIHLQDADTANATMMTTVWLVLSAPPTIPQLTVALPLVHEHFHIWRLDQF